MPVRRKKGSQENLIYRNERYTKGVVTSNDPMFEGSFRRLINFKVSNQNASLENRIPFLTVPLFNSKNEEIKISSNSFLFSLNEDTEHSFIIDFNQEVKEVSKDPIFLHRVFFRNNEYYSGLSKIELDIVDGDTIKINNQRYRLAIIDAPELEDEIYEKSTKENLEDISTLGEEAKLELKNLLLEKSFDIIQYDFQSEKIDEFGRPLVFIRYKENNEYNFANITLLKEGYASIYNIEKYKKEIINLVIPEEINIYDNTPYELAEEIKQAISKGKEKTHSPLYQTYLDKSIQVTKDSSIYAPSKPMVYKIKKDTDLKYPQFEKDNLIYNKLLKRSIKEFEINELKVKLDLEIFTDQPLKYVLRSKDFIITNTKYENQAVIILVSVFDSQDTHIYTGPAEITRTSPNNEEGIFETINIRTYNNPEMHVELQNLTNFKPNMLSANSIIPETIKNEVANVRGYSTPSVDTVLVGALVNSNNSTNIDSTTIDFITKKYLGPTNLKWSDKDSYIIEPFYKKPVILNSEKTKYMYRWDLISNKELDTFDEETLKKFKPIYRSNWVDFENHNINISTHKGRLFNRIISKKDIQAVDEIFIISYDYVIDKTGTESIKDFLDINEEVLLIGGKTLTELDDGLQKLIYSHSMDLKKLLKKITEESLFEEEFNPIQKTMSIEKLNMNEKLISDLIRFEKDDNLVFLEMRKGQRKKPITPEEIEKILEDKDKKTLFIFMPIVVSLKDENKRTMHVFHSSKKLTILNEPIEEKYLPIELNFADLKEKTFNEMSFDEFFKDGFTATFYLSTYDGVHDLLERDEFYDILAYKASSTTYTFKKTGGNNYLPSDFIKENFAKESAAIKYCKYFSEYNDRILMYGNSMYKNSVFMSEEGSPYYFPLVNTFEFDYEVIHVQQFKTIMLVFTINDIWAIYEIEEKEQQEYKDEEGETQTYEVTKRSFRSKKILYNISTTHENKCTIKNISRYITLMSNDVLYLIRPSLYISDDTQFTLNIVSSNIDALVKDPLSFINERLIYYGIKEKATSYKMNFNATDNFIKIYYSTEISNIPYTLILTYDILNNRWYEEDTIAFGYPSQIYLIDATTGYEMLTEANGQVYFTYNTDKYKNLLTNSYGEYLYDVFPSEHKHIEQRIQSYIDTGNIKLSEHLRKRFRHLHINMKNIDSKEILFSYNFSVDDVQFESNIVPEYTTNSDNNITEILKLKEFLFRLENSNIYSQDFVNEIMFKFLTSQEFVKNLDSEIKYNPNVIIELMMKEDDISKNKLDLILKNEIVIDSGALDSFLLDFSNLHSSDIMMIRHNLLGRGRIPRLKLNFSTKGRFYILSYSLTYRERQGN